MSRETTFAPFPETDRYLVEFRDGKGPSARWVTATEAETPETIYGAICLVLEQCDIWNGFRVLHIRHDGPPRDATDDVVRDIAELAVCEPDEAGGPGFPIPGWMEDHPIYARTLREAQAEFRAELSPRKHAEYARAEREGLL